MKFLIYVIVSYSGKNIDCSECGRWEHYIHIVLYINVFIEIHTFARAK